MPTPDQLRWAEQAAQLASIDSGVPLGLTPAQEARNRSASPGSVMFDTARADDQASMDQMRLALSKQQPKRPLDTVSDTFKTIAANSNPLLFMKSMQDMVRTAVVAPMAPVAAGVSSFVQHAAAAPGLAYRSYLGDEQSKREAEEIRLNLPSADALNRQYQEKLAPQTPAGQQFAEGLGSAMETAKVPHAWPITGGLSQRRPALTPNDVRAMGAQAAHFGREAMAVPTDIANARQGIQRLSPLTGEPSVGSRVGTTMTETGQSIGEMLDRREAMGLPAMPGVPGGSFIDPNMYAIRPTPSNIVNPRYPAGTQIADMARDTSGLPILSAEIQGGPASASTMPFRSPADIISFLSGQLDRAGVLSTFEQFMADKAMQLYPDAPTPQEARSAYQARFGTSNAKHDATRQLYDEFVASRPDLGLVSVTEVEARRTAATDFIENNFIPYLSRVIGTATDPGLVLAQQGITMTSPESTRTAADFASRDIEKHRASAPDIDDPQGEGVTSPMHDEVMTEQGTLAAETRLLQAQLDRTNAIVQERNAEALALDPNATTMGPNDFNPQHHETSAQVRANTTRLAALDKRLGELKIGASYETRMDRAVEPTTQGEIKRVMPYAEQQFVKGLGKQRDTNVAYRMGTLGHDLLREEGYTAFGQSIVADILSGKIPLDKVPKLKVENMLARYAGEKTTKRAEEAERAKNIVANTHKFFADVIKDPATGAQPLVGGVSVITLDSNVSASIINRRMSEDTAILDLCIGEGGSASGLPRNAITGKTHSYRPMLDLFTGLQDVNSRQATSSFGERTARGDMVVASFRDSETGMPLATLNFGSLNSNGTRSGQYVSGFSNGVVDDKARPAIAQWLNAHPEYRPAVNKLHENAELYDLRSTDSVDDLERNLMAAERARFKAIKPALADFTDNHIVSIQDIKDIIARSMSNPSTALTVPRATSAPVVAPSAPAAHEYAQLVRRDFAELLYTETEDGVHAGVMTEILNNNWDVGLALTNPEQLAMQLASDIRRRENVLRNTMPDDVSSHAAEDARYRINLYNDIISDLEQLTTSRPYAPSADDIIANDDGTPEYRQVVDNARTIVDNDLRDFALPVVLSNVEQVARDAYNRGDNAYGDALMYYRDQATRGDTLPEPALAPVGDWEPEADIYNTPALLQGPAPRNSSAVWAPLSQDIINMPIEHLDAALTPRGVWVADTQRSYMLRNHEVQELSGIVESIRAGNAIANMPFVLNELQRERLARMLEEHISQNPPQHFQEGGSVKTPWLLQVPTYSETVAYEMYPGQGGQDDQRDAARHMLAAGTLSRKYGEGPAKFMGKAHEYMTSPYQAVKTLFGGEMPKDFEMDTHNNEIGIMLAKQSKTQEDFERLVQDEAERASKTKQSGRAYTKKAKGGTVQDTPSLDEMRYALMRR